MGSVFGGGGDSQTVVQNNNPPAYALPYLTRGMERSERGFNLQPPMFSPYPGYVRASPQTNYALGGLQNMALGGGPMGSRMGQQEFARTVGGYYGPGNPGFTGAVDEAVKFAIPRINRAANVAGRSGSPEETELIAKTIGEAFRAEYGAERGRQLGALGMTPQFNELGYDPFSRLAQVGEAREAEIGQQLSDLNSRWNYYQGLPDARLDQYLGRIGAGVLPGTSQSSSQTDTSRGIGSRLAGAAGAGVLGYGLGSSLAAPQALAAGLAGPPAPSWLASAGLGGLTPYAPWLGAGLGALLGFA